MPVQAAVLAASNDTVEHLAILLWQAGHAVVSRAVVADEEDALAAKLETWIADKIELVIGVSSEEMRGALVPLITKRLLGFNDLSDVDGGRCQSTIVVLLPASRITQELVEKVSARVENELARKPNASGPAKVSIPAIPAVPAVPKIVPPVRKAEPANVAAPAPPKASVPMPPKANVPKPPPVPPKRDASKPALAAKPEVSVTEKLDDLDLQPVVDPPKVIIPKRVNTPPAFPRELRPPAPPAAARAAQPKKPQPVAQKPAEPAEAKTAERAEPKPAVAEPKIAEPKPAAVDAKHAESNQPTPSVIVGEQLTPSVIVDEQLESDKPNVVAVEQPKAEVVTDKAIVVEKTKSEPAGEAKSRAAPPPRVEQETVLGDGKSPVVSKAKSEPAVEAKSKPAPPPRVEQETVLGVGESSVVEKPKSEPAAATKSKPPPRVEQETVLGDAGSVVERKPAARPAGAPVLPIAPSRSRLWIPIVGVAVLGAAAAAGVMITRDKKSEPTVTAQNDLPPKPTGTPASDTVANETPAEAPPAEALPAETPPAETAAAPTPPTSETPTAKAPPVTSTPTKPTATKSTKPATSAVTPSTTTAPTAETPKATTPKPPKTAEPAAAETPSDGCDQASCVLDNFAKPCCARYKPRAAGAAPYELDGGMVRAGMMKVKAAVIRCGEQHPAKGLVKLAMEVGGDGRVKSASASEAPDPALGECVATAAKRAVFTQTEIGGSFTYPFNF